VALHDVVERPLERRDIDMASDAQSGDNGEPVAEGAIQVALVQRVEVLLGKGQRIPPGRDVRLAGGLLRHRPPVLLPLAVSQSGGRPFLAFHP